MSKIITIGREFGSGVRELGRRLSEKLGYHFDHPYTAWFQPQIVRTAKEKSQHG